MTYSVICWVACSVVEVHLGLVDLEVAGESKGARILYIHSSMYNLDLLFGLIVKELCTFNRN